ncbi:ClpP/crotonase-like domain-containing protein [Scenedesmus sp. NREL 46B-D3]|nr:ClpP/crotonase-like domain-containing protein [Scenedesmus sp. NREL 46B-D3]
MRHSTTSSLPHPMLLPGRFMRHIPSKPRLPLDSRTSAAAAAAAAGAASAAWSQPAARRLAAATGIAPSMAAATPRLASHAPAAAAVPSLTTPAAQLLAAKVSTGATRCRRPLASTASRHRSTVSSPRRCTRQGQSVVATASIASFALALKLSAKSAEFAVKICVSSGTRPPPRRCSGQEMATLVASWRMPGASQMVSPGLQEQYNTIQHDTRPVNLSAAAGALSTRRSKLHASSWPNSVNRPAGWCTHCTGSATCLRRPPLPCPRASLLARWRSAQPPATCACQPSGGGSAADYASAGPAGGKQNENRAAAQAHLVMERSLVIAGMASSAGRESKAAPASSLCNVCCNKCTRGLSDAKHVEQLQQQLLAWAHASRGVKAVLLDSDNDRSFCSDCLLFYRCFCCCVAGGDVKAARQAVLDSPYTDSPPAGHHIHRVFQAEYSTLLLIAGYSLPLVSCCQGIWMGLGFGIAGFGRYRVVSDGTIFAMPENAIGLWPDVGFAFKAARMPGQLGLFLGLSGVRLSSPADLLHTGIATHYIAEDQLQAFKQQLSQDPAALESLLQQYSCVPPDTPGPLQRLQPVIDKHLEQLVAACRQAGCDELGALHAALQGLQRELPAVHVSDHQAAHLLQNAIQSWAYGSPRSLTITLQHFMRVHDAVHGGRAAAGGQADLSTLTGVMHMEYQMAVRQVAHEDFLEGVRAALVDKDRRPAWLAGAEHHHQGTPAAAAEIAEKPLQSSLPGNRFSVQQLFQQPDDEADKQHLLL